MQILMDYFTLCGIIAQWLESFWGGEQESILSDPPAHPTVQGKVIL